MEECRKAGAKNTGIVSKHTNCCRADLALSVTKNINNSEFTILLILIILFVTIFFCHGLIRLCMLIVRPKSHENENRARLPDMFGPGGYAVPRRPIRVLLARDEEAAGLESETTKSLPPAYGLWRESVVCIQSVIYRKDQLTIDSAWTQIVSTGSATRPNRVLILSRLVQRQRTDPPRMPRTTA